MLRKYKVFAPFEGDFVEVLSGIKGGDNVVLEGARAVKDGQQVKILTAAIGMVVFEVSRAWVFAALDLEATDVRLVSALVVLVALAAPNVAERWRNWRRRRALEADDAAAG